MSLGVINLHTNGAKVFMKSIKKFKTLEFYDLFSKMSIFDQVSIYPVGINILFIVFSN